eukprot:CAMPEP_0118656828 /NCGR_PEP_ID=MMETSP0785-20121206/13689_1 /TAXON_ID=91992 /ORGANISM="Bolidomonas pacifica, Strain CCMP 1866" /LENGTH=359 /DNA_ID=CAMNT_0006549697 /DNA_START=74 /DNA_END=1150 /DNA_ORIENTATION=+
MPTLVTHGNANAGHLRSYATEVESKEFTGGKSGYGESIKHVVDKLGLFYDLSTLLSPRSLTSTPSPLVPPLGTFLNNPTLTSTPNLHPYLQPIYQEEASELQLCVLHTLGAKPSLAISKPGHSGYEVICNNEDDMVRRVLANAEVEGKVGKDEIEGIASGLNGIEYKPGEAGMLGLKLGVQKYSLLKIGPFRDYYDYVACEKLNGGKDDVDVLATVEVGNGKFGDGRGMLFYAEVLERLDSTSGGRGGEVRDAARGVIKTGLGLGSIGVDLKGRIERARVLGGIEGEFKDWYKRVKDAEASQGSAPSAGDNDEGSKDELEMAFEEGKEVCDVWCLEKEGWEGCKEEVAKCFEGIEGAER